MLPPPQSEAEAGASSAVPLPTLERPDVRQDGPRSRGSGRWRRSGRGSRRGLLRGLGILLVAMIALGAVGEYGYLEYHRLTRLVGATAQDFRSGQQHLEEGKASLRQASSAHDPAKIQQAKTSFTAAAASFKRARERVDHDPTFLRASMVPVVSSYVGPRLAAVDSLADMGIAVSQAALDGSDIDALLTAGGGTGSVGTQLLATLKLAGPRAARVKQDLLDAQRAAAKVKPSLLPSSELAAFTSAEASITTGLASIDEFNRLIPVMLEVMGANGPRTYLVEQLNPAELRPGGGFFGTYSLISANNGNLTVTGGGNSYDQTAVRPTIGQPGYVAPPGPLRELISNSSWSMPDSNFFPDFASNAQEGEAFLTARTGVKPDGVIGLDMYAVAALLNITGPIHVAAYNATFDSTNFIPELIKRDVAGDSTHKALLAEVSGPLLERISTLPSSSWTGLISTLNSLAAQRHLQTFFHNGPAETEMGNIGWSGALHPTRATDYMYTVEANLGGTKANYFLTREYALVLTRNGNLLHHQLTISYEDDSKLANTNYYSCYLRLFVPSDATGLGVQGLRPDKYSPPDVPPGLKMVDGWFALNVDSRTSRGTSQVVLTFDTPWQPDAAGDHVIYWQKQPGLRLDSVSVSMNLDGHASSATGDLAQDRKVVVSAAGAVTIVPGQAGSAHLPDLTL